MEELYALLDTILRSILAVITLQLLARMNGAKQISQLSFYDYISGITIGSMAAVMAIDDQIPFWLPLASMIVFVLATYLESRISLRSIKFRKWINGTPLVLIYHGKLIEANMKKAHVNVHDLLSEARVHGYFNLQDLAYAIMENSGKISFLVNDDQQPATKQDMNITPKPMTSTFYVDVVIDGVLLEKELESIGKNVSWFHRRCQELHYDNVSEILLAIANQDNDLYVFYKNKTCPHT